MLNFLGSSLLTAIAALNLVASQPAVAKETIVKKANGIYTQAGPKTLAKKPKPKPAPRYTARSPFQLSSRGSHAATSRTTQVLSYSASAYKSPPPRVVGNVNVSEVILLEARKNDIDPLILELIIKQESNFDPSAVSRVGAQGLMQLMPATAADLGVADPLDPHQNVAGGARYFASQLDSFGDLRLALAAYNAGPGNVARYGGVPPFEETQHYVARIAGEYELRRRGF